MFGSSARNSHLVLRTVRSAISRILRLLWWRALSARAEAVGHFAIHQRRSKNAVGRTYAQKLIDLSVYRTLSLRMCSGTPCVTISSPSTSNTSWLFNRRSTLIARHSRVNSSITVSMRNLRPSCVRSCTKSYAHTWFRCRGRSRIHEPSLNHSLPRFGCFCGTFRPSRRHIRKTRLWFTRQPSACRSAVIRL